MTDPKPALLPVEQLADALENDITCAREMGGAILISVREAAEILSILRLTTPAPTCEEPGEVEDAVERAAIAIALARFKDHTPPVRWPADRDDKLSGRDGTVPLTWDYAEECREVARVVLLSLRPAASAENGLREDRDRIARSHDHVTGLWAEQCGRNRQLGDENRDLRKALLSIRDWQLLDDNRNPNVPADYEGSPYDYLKKMANDALKTAVATPSQTAENADGEGGVERQSFIDGLQNDVDCCSELGSSVLLSIKQARKIIALLSTAQPPAGALDQEAWQPRIGDRVTASEHFLEIYGEWRGDELWIVGMQQERGINGINVSVSMEWPVHAKSDGYTDGFYIGRDHVPDDLIPLNLIAGRA